MLSILIITYFAAVLTMKSVILLAPMTIYPKKYLFGALDNLPIFTSYSPMTGTVLARE